LPKIKEIYSIKETSNLQGFFLVSDREGSSIGSIQFRDDKVVVVNKDWGTFKETEGLQIVKSIFGALSLFADKNVSTKIASHKTSAPMITTEGVTLYSGRHEILIDLIEQKRVKSISIVEILR